MLTCPLCKYSGSERILDKPAIPIFTNVDDSCLDGHESYPCELHQCAYCGHVFQAVSERLKNALDNLYRSNHAQITTPLGSGNWGKERVPYLLEKFKRIEKYDRNASILELGCGNGYILRMLKEMGFHDLTGIEPSLSTTEDVNGVLFIKDFVRDGLELGKEFDFIFSFGVYEHIEDINIFTNFSANHLKSSGELFIYVPNCEKSLDSGDPGVFAHQHVQYFVKQSLINHLRSHGFGIVEDLSDVHALAIFAKRSIETQGYCKIETRAEFQNEVDKNLSTVRDVFEKKNLIVHGACNALNNILGWLGKDYDFTLFDNDTTKHGKIFFGKKVHSISMTNLAEFRTILIIPTNFVDIIMKAYSKAGFEGEFRIIG